MRKCAAGPALLLLAGVLHAQIPSTGPSVEVALSWLRYGNERHAAGKAVHWHQTIGRRQAVAKAQKPFAIIVSCSDSSVPPEILFDQGIGDLFVIRVAGPTMGERELAIIEFAAGEFRVPLAIVMGHQHCSLVAAAMRRGPASGAMGVLLAPIAVSTARAQGLPGDSIENATLAHVDNTVALIRDAEPMLAPLVRAGKLKVVGSYYNAGSGEVRWLGEPLRTSRLPPLPR